jgi:ferredoxin
MQKRRPNIKAEYVLSEQADWAGVCGFITKDVISKFVASIKDKFFYIVGNQAMYQFINEQLKDLSVPRHRVIYEAYGVPDDITKIMGWPEDIDTNKTVQIKVEIMRNGKRDQKTFEAKCCEPLLNSIERTKELGALIDGGCRSGECALCRTKLISGKVFIPPDVIIREIDNEYGYIHPCISYPITDLHLDLTIT